MSRLGPIDLISIPPGIHGHKLDRYEILLKMGQLKPEFFSEISGQIRLGPKFFENSGPARTGKNRFDKQTFRTRAEWLIDVESNGPEIMDQNFLTRLELMKAPFQQRRLSF